MNRLALNIKKTNFVIFHPFNKPPKDLITIKINKKSIAEVKYVKYLGILVDSKLTWKFHIDNLAKKISRAIGVMFKIRCFCIKRYFKKYISQYYLSSFTLCNRSMGFYFWCISQQNHSTAKENSQNDDFQCNIFFRGRTSCSFFTLI